MTNLITLAGNGARFSIEGFDLPKPLILVKGIPMIFRAVDSLPIADKYVFVCKSDHIKKYNLGKILSNKYPNVEIVTVDKTTKGQACTAEIGILNSTIDIDDEILISSCDYGLKWNNKFYNKLTSDIIVWSTIHNKSFSSNPNSYSWLSVDSSGNLLKTYVKQKTFKNSYNEHAIVGTFYFKKAKYFLEGLEQIYKNNITSNGEFYIDNIFNSITDLDVKIFDVDEYYCWGTPKDLKDYEN
jgi:NDP-sugar pyrophosphorylase family protein|tara:strand:+ start:13714 stop:14436 length:723 start_codon:yes stop_codon:yes gene_type:complete